MPLVEWGGITHRTSTGLCLLAGGLFCLSSAVYVWLRLHG